MPRICEPKGQFKHDLAEAELPYADFNRAMRFFRDRKVDFNYVPRRGFRFTAWVADRPQMIIIWCGNGTVREYLDAPSTLFADMKRLEREALAHS
jgi:hypothetical protein